MCYYTANGIKPCILLVRHCEGFHPKQSLHNAPDRKIASGKSPRNDASVEIELYKFTPFYV